MARLANVTKAVSNTYKYVSKQPVGAAVFLIALDLARRVAQSPVGVSVRDAIGSFVGGRAMVLDQMRRDLAVLAAGITASATNVTRTAAEQAAAAAEMVQQLADFLKLLNGSARITNATRQAAINSLQ
jgi:hypothetical protein